MALIHTPPKILEYKKEATPSNQCGPLIKEISYGSRPLQDLLILGSRIIGIGDCFRLPNHLQELGSVATRVFANGASGS